MIRPTWAAVRSLYSLQNAIILTPCGPRAVPIGGAGLAFPAGICSLTTVLTRFAIQFYTPRNSLDFLDLQEIQYHRRFSTEKGNKYSDLVPIHIDVADRADELRERPIDDTHTLAFREADFSLWLVRLLCDLFQDCLDLVFLERDRPGTRANKASHTRGITHNVPCFVAHNHLHQHIAGEDLTLYCAPLALLDLYFFFHGDNHPEDFITHIHRGNTRLEMAFHLIFVTRVSVNSIPGTFIFLRCLIWWCGMFSNHSISPHIFLVAILLDASQMGNQEIELAKPQVC